MRGRTEDKIKFEKKIQGKIKNLPDYMIDYYYYLNEKTHMTKMIYINNVIRFLKWYGNEDVNNVSENDLDHITPRVIQNYMSDIQFSEDKELGNDAKSNIYSSLNSFLVFLKKNNIIRDNPFDGDRISRPKAHDNEITFLEPEEFASIKRKIMNGVGNNRAIARQKKWIYRDLLLFQIPIITGVRVTALSQISIDDIDFDKMCIRVIDKAREKVLYLDDETLNLIYIWIENRKEILKGCVDCGYLFISNRKTKMDISSIENVIEKYTVDIDKHITPHKLRSTCGTNMYRATKDIYIVAETLGHKSPATSRKYTKVDSKDRVNATKLLAQQMKGN